MGLVNHFFCPNCKKMVKTDFGKRRKEIGQFILDNPNMVYKDIARHFKMSHVSIKHIGMMIGANRPPGAKTKRNG